MRKQNDFFAVGGALRRGCILIRNRDGCSDILELAGMFDATSHVGLGWGVGRGVVTSLNLRACLMPCDMWGLGGWVDATH